MLIRNANDVLMSQAVDKEEEQFEVEGSPPQKQGTEGSRNSNESSYNPEQSQEDLSAHDNGRSSVISDPGYISCAGSDHSSVLSVEGEQGLEDCVGYNSTEYNAVISPCNTSITDVLNDTYIASNRNSPISDTDSIFMPSPPSPNSAAENLEKTLCERARSLQQETRSNPAMPTTMNWSSVHQNNSISSGNYDQRIDFDMFFDGVLETKYADNSGSSIFSNADDKYHQDQNNNSVAQNTPFVSQQTNDLSHNRECKSNLPADEFSSYSVEDFCFDEEILGTNANMHETAHNRCLSPNSGFHDDEMLQQHRSHQYYENNSNTSAQYARYQESSSSKPYDFSTTTSRRTNGVSNKRMHSRVFARTSAEKTESASASGSIEAKQVTQTPTSAEEEAWRSYLENPLTAATTAMMSFQGDEDSAAALGMLYDYYKVPREKRLLSYPAKINEMSQARTLVPQKTIPCTAAIPTTASASQKGSSFANSSIHARKLGTDVIAMRPVKSEPGSGTQVFESVSDIIKQHRSTSLEESKVKKEIVTESPQDLSTAFPDAKVATPSSRLYPTNSNGSNNSYTSNSTSHFTTLSPFSTTLQNSYSLANSAQSSSYLGPSFEYIMEAPKSLKQKESDPTMSYINKGQFYCITLRNASEHWKFKSSRVKSVVHIVFGDGKSEEEQLRHWKYWHARQHTVKQRIIDIADYKESSMIYDVDEIGHNAISFSWNVSEIAKIFISCNCLSTDFSAQKGIKGVPLLIQIDTYLDGQDTPFHRGHCQIKVFCDKGAERKIRDEERKATKRRQKNSKQNSNVNANSSSSTSLLTIAAPELKQMVTSSSTAPSQAGQNPPKKTDFVIFKTVNDLDTVPVLFVPEVPGHSISSHCNPVAISPNAASSLSPHLGLAVISESEQSYFGSTELAERGVKRAHSEDEQRGPVAKISKTGDGERVLLYVRKEDEDVYDGLMLKTPDLKGLKSAIEEKYRCSAENIKGIFKKSKKGILVRMDDNIVRHYSNEDTFVIDIQEQSDDDVTTFKVTFTEV